MRNLEALLEGRDGDSCRCWRRWRGRSKQYPTLSPERLKCRRVIFIYGSELCELMCHRNTLGFVLYSPSLQCSLLQTVKCFTQGRSFWNQESLQLLLLERDPSGVLFASLRNSVRPAQLCAGWEGCGDSCDTQSQAPCGTNCSRTGPGVFQASRAVRALSVLSKGNSAFGFLPNCQVCTCIYNSLFPRLTVEYLSCMTAWNSSSCALWLVFPACISSFVLVCSGCLSEDLRLQLCWCSL